MNNPFQMQTPFGKTSATTSNKKNNNPQGASFLEAIREQGQAATTGFAQDFGDQLFGQSAPRQDFFPQQNNFNQMPNMPMNPNMGMPNLSNPNTMPQGFAEFLKMRENQAALQAAARERQFAQQQRMQERNIFNSKENATQNQIRSIRMELTQLIKTSGVVNQQIEMTISQNIVEAGTYQINFFDRIKRLIVLARKQLSEANIWLEEFQSRKHKKSGFWGKVQKHGTSFMLSNERTTATQTG